jgi:hypothetical protein
MKVFARCNEALAEVLGRLWSAPPRGLEPLMFSNIDRGRQSGTDAAG